MSVVKDAHSAVFLVFWFFGFLVFWFLVFGLPDRGIEPRTFSLLERRSADELVGLLPPSTDGN